jgi:hypothetical protein
VSDDVLIEMTVWPVWTAGVSSLSGSVGVLARANGASGIFAGVTKGNRVVLEQWVDGKSVATLASFDLATLPSNQAHAAVDGWNMLRLEISGGNASVWWNPTHADPGGRSRGLRVSAAVPPSLSVSNSGLAAAVAGVGTAMKVDYVSVFQSPSSS